VVTAELLQTTFERLEQNLNALAVERGELALTVPMACLVARKPGGNQWPGMAPPVGSLP
jgi:hypothetical protein